MKNTRDKNIFAGSGFALDTTFVLFFLAIDLGQSVGTFGLDSVLSAVTLGLFIVLPYFLPSEKTRPDFTHWLIGRMFIAGLALLLGAIYGSALGVTLPETLRFLPMTLLIVSGMLSCYIQFYGLMKFRPAK